MTAHLTPEGVAEHIKAIIAEASERGIDVHLYKGNLWVSHAGDYLGQGERIEL